MLSAIDLLTTYYVREELRHAFATLARLPEKQRPRVWYVPTPDVRATPPTASEVARMHEALAWLALLHDEPIAVRLAVSLRARGLSLREVASEIGNISAPTVAVREARGLDLIVQRLRAMGTLPGDPTIDRAAA